MKSLVRPSVAVLIPIYQTHLSDSERASLVRCMQVLSAYPRMLITPESLRVEPLLAEFPELGRHSFPDHFFTGTDSYNKLLTSVDFYRPFQAYDYVLIYQLDAWVFRDELPYWCSLGLDYIGAPTVHKEAYNALPATAKEELSQVLSASRQLIFNGGLSLRRVAGLMRYLRIYTSLYPAWKGNEDMLFSRASTRLLPLKYFIKLPTWKQALRFAFEKSPAASYELTGHTLPFGCHAWERYAPEFWAPFVASDSHSFNKN